MTGLIITFTKRGDGSTVSRYERPDATVTWQRKLDESGFFTFHDLTHYAVETILEFRKGFYGLVADGWDLSDFGTPWPRGPLPPDTDPAVVIVGFFECELRDDTTWTDTQFNENAAMCFANHGMSDPPVLDQARLDQIRVVMHRLHEDWRQLKTGATMSLDFNLDFPRESEGLKIRS